MGKVKKPSDAIVKGPEPTGAETSARALAARTTIRRHAAPRRQALHQRREASRGSLSGLAKQRPVCDRQDTATDRRTRRIVMAPKPVPSEEPPVDAPTWTPDVREPDPDLLPDEMPVPNPDENRDAPKRALT